MKICGLNILINRLHFTGCVFFLPQHKTYHFPAMAAPEPKLYAWPESFYLDMTAEAYKRSGGKMDDVESLVRGDGAAFIHGFHQKYAPMSRYLLDHHHLCDK